MNIGVPQKVHEIVPLQEPVPRPALPAEPSEPMRQPVKEREHVDR